MFPGAIGGGNWDGVAFNKKLGLVITNVMNAGQWGHLEEVKPARARRSGGDRPGGPAAPAAVDAAARGPAARAAAVRRRSREPYRKVTPEGGRFWDPKTRYSCNAAAVGRADRGQRQHRRHRVARAARQLRRAREEGHQDRHGRASAARSPPPAISSSSPRPSTATSAPSTRGTARSCGRRSSTVPAHAIPSTYMGTDGKQYVVDHGRRRRIPPQPAQSTQWWRSGCRKAGIRDDVAPDLDLGDCADGVRTRRASSAHAPQPLRGCRRGRAGQPGRGGGPRRRPANARKVVLAWADTRNGTRSTSSRRTRCR